MNNTDRTHTKVEEFIVIRDAETGESILAQRGNIKSTESAEDDE